MDVHPVVLTDEAVGSQAAVAPELGFNCYRFHGVVDGQPLEVLWSEEDFTSGTKRATRSGIPLLFPFPGRISGTEFHWDGKTYQLEAGDGRGNAIHGFACHRPWRVIEQSSNHVTGQFQASVAEPALLKLWPSDLRITATYRLLGNRLQASYLLENPGEAPLPCGFGAHPYFTVPLGSGTANECRVKLPVGVRWELTEMLPTGRELPLDDAAKFHDGLRFGEMQFDDVLGQIEFVDSKSTASIEDPSSGRRVQIHFARPFRELVVYTPAHRGAVCIEPYTCVPDAARLQSLGIDAGLQVLAPGASLQCELEIEAL